MSGRAGRRGLDERGVVIMMIDEKMEPAVAKGMVKVNNFLSWIYIYSAIIYSCDFNQGLTFFFLFGAGMGIIG